MAAWQYLVLRALKSGERWIQPGELTTVPNTWTHQVLMAHLNGGLIEKAKLLEDEEYEQQAYPTGAPENYDDLRATPPPRLAGSYREDVFTGEKEGDRRFSSKKPLTWIRCWNCSAQCYTPKDLEPTIPYECPACHQVQTEEQARERWKQQSAVDLLQESLMGVHDHPEVMTR